MDGNGSEYQTFGFSGAQFNRLVNCEVTGMDGRNSGAGATGGSNANNKILGCYIHDTGSTSTDSNEAKLFHGVYFDDTGHDIEIGWNHIADINGGRGIQFFDSNGDMYNLEVHDNFIHGSNHDGITFASSVSTGCKVYNNIFYGHPDAAIDIRDNDVVVDIFNNTIYVDTSGDGFGLFGYNACTIKNNIIYSTGIGDYFNLTVGDPIASTNIWYGNGGVPSWDSEGINQDPLFVNATSDFHLQPDSPAIDAGVDTGITHGYDGNNNIFRKNTMYSFSGDGIQIIHGTASGTINRREPYVL
jgi:hypothetical protein